MSSSKTKYCILNLSFLQNKEEAIHREERRGGQGGGGDRPRGVGEPQEEERLGHPGHIPWITEEHPSMPGMQ